MVNPPAKGSATSAVALVLPLALAQFLASFAATNMNVSISAIATDLDTSVSGLQTTITLFTLTMAALMIPGSKLSDLWGRKLCFRLGLAIYGTGALLAGLAPGLGLMIFGYSLLEGIGSALLIPPIYILITVWFSDVRSRARYYGVVSGAAGLGAATGPLLGGLLTSYISWRASFALQVLTVLVILLLARRLVDPARTGVAPRFDLVGAVLSAAGLFFVVLGILQASTYGWLRSRKDFTIGDTVIISAGGISPVWLFVAVGAVFLLWFFLHIRRREQHGKDPLISIRLFRSRTSNLGLVTQNVQWLTMQGSFFVISVYLQEVQHFSAIETGLTLVPATAGLLLAAGRADRLSRRTSQPVLIRYGFAAMAVGMALLPLLFSESAAALSLLPGLFFMGAGLGVMITSSVNVVQSAFGHAEQGDISGLSRSVSNLGSSLGTAIAGSVLVAAVAGRPFLAALVLLLVIAMIGLVAALLLPKPAHDPAARP